MNFEFRCREGTCRATVEIRSPIGKAPKVPYHHKRPMDRVYSAPRFQVERSIADYANAAYDGTETVPGMTTQEIRQMVDINPRPSS